MGIGSLILPYHASPRRLAEGYLFVFALFVYIISAGLATGKTGFKMGVGAQENAFKRSKNPREYWLILAVYGAFLFLTTKQLIDLVPVVVGP